jgi:membrane-associated phospholipid phosphatase
MTDPQIFDAGPVWQAISRLGEAQILIPAAALMVLVLTARPQSRRLALHWLALIAVATVITTASKLAFLGWGIGFAPCDFTGISGHAMFAAAIYPVLAFVVLPTRTWGTARVAIAMGGMLALLVGLSRLMVGAHSNSEVLTGLLLGGTASVLAIRLASLPSPRLHPICSVMLVVWFLWGPSKMPGSQTHSWVTRLALALSGHEAPFTRSHLFEPRAIVH